MNIFKNTGGTGETGRGTGPLKHPIKPFFTTLGLALPRFTCEVSKGYITSTEGNYFRFETSLLCTQLHNLGDRWDPCSINS